MHHTDFIQKTYPFLLIGFIYILVGLTLDKYYGEEELHLLLNSYYHPFFDIFFKYYTKLGEFLYGAIILIFLIKRLSYRELFIFLSSALLQSLIVQTLKRSFFIHHHRPGFYFQEKGIPLHLVEGVKQGITFTFPSGHTATVFAVFLFLALLTKNRWLQSLLGIGAVLGAYSRIYLSQHFMQDTIAGAFIGMFAVVVAFYIWNGMNRPFLNKNLIQNLRK